MTAGTPAPERLASSALTMRLPAAPLVEEVERRGGISAVVTDPHDRTTYLRIRKAGRMTIALADRLAVRLLGLHPSLVWPEWFDLPVPPDLPAGERCAYRGCPYPRHSRGLCLNHYTAAHRGRLEVATC